MEQRVSKEPISTGESGFVLLTTMMILVMVTLLGLAALSTSVFEISIAGNERRYQEQFYRADSAINEILARAQRTEMKPIDTQAVCPSGVCTSSCNDMDTSNQINGKDPYFTSNLDGTGNTVNVFYRKRVNQTPFLAELMTCSSQGTVIAEIVAGIEFGLAPGAIPGQGDELEYN